MKTIKEYIASRQQLVTQHPILLNIQHEGTLQQALQGLPNLAFWMLGFQDMLRISILRIQAAEERNLAHCYFLEMNNSVRWFIHDLTRLGGPFPSLLEVFSEENKDTRCATYGLLSEVFATGSDHERLVLVMAATAIARAFQSSMAALTAREGVLVPLRYFSRRDQPISPSQEAVIAQGALILESLTLSDLERAVGRHLVNRVYDTFDVLLRSFWKMAVVQPMEVR